jgi:hypothetical protein
MEATYLRQHASKTTGTQVFVYALKGTDADLQRVRDIQGDNHRTDKVTGVDLWFTTRYSGDNVKVIITDNDKIVPDLGDIKKMESLSKQFEGKLGEEIAKQAAAMLLGNLFAKNTAQSSSTPEKNVSNSEDLKDL